MVQSSNINKAEAILLNLFNVGLYGKRFLKLYCSSYLAKGGLRARLLVEVDTDKAARPYNSIRDLDD